MNEIELLQRLRQDVPDPDEATLQAARSALMERIESPFRSVSRPQRPSRRRMVLALTAATAAVVSVGLILSILLPRGGTSAAAAELRRFAAVAAQQPGPEPLGPGRYFYLTEEGRTQFTDISSRSTAYSVQIPIVREYWIREDGWGRSVETQAGEFIWPGPRDKARWEAQGSLPLYGPSDSRGQLVRGELDGSDLGTLPPGYDFETLPREPKALYEVISVAAAESEPRTPGIAPSDPTPVGTTGFIFELLHTPLTPSDVRAALFEAAAYIPGITVVRDKTIPGMGTGGAVILESSYCCRGEIRVRREFLIDPETSYLLGYQETLLDRPYWFDADPPFVTHSMAYAPPRIVDSIAERP